MAGAIVERRSVGENRTLTPAYNKLNPDLTTLLEKSENVLSFAGKKGNDLYDSLDNIRRAGLLNIAVKSGATPLTNGRTVLSYIWSLNEIGGDRFFCVVPKDLREETKNSVAEGLFRKVDGSLHHPPPGFTPAESFQDPRSLWKPPVDVLREGR